ncbi:MAG: SRPBCC domain-containing protein [Methylocella sp.]
MNNAVEQLVTREIVVDEVLLHTPEVIWKTLTSAELIGRWLMPNKFEPIVGRRFTFQAQPMGDRNGVVDCLAATSQ